MPQPGEAQAVQLDNSPTRCNQRKAAQSNGDQGQQKQNKQVYKSFLKIVLNNSRYYAGDMQPSCIWVALGQFDNGLINQEGDIIATQETLCVLSSPHSAVFLFTDEARDSP